MSAPWLRALRILSDELKTPNPLDGERLSSNKEAAMAIVQVTEKNFEQTAKQGIVLRDFWASARAARSRRSSRRRRRGIRTWSSARSTRRPSEGWPLPLRSAPSP